MVSSQYLLFREAGQEYGLVRSYIGHGSFNVQVLGAEDDSSPCIITAVVRKHVSVAAGDIVLLSLDESTSEDAEIIKVYEEREIEELIVRGEISSRFEIIPED
ncbi:hypothetical protein F4813DRAFT_390804 [Daldinia decipiens]|uniref:uncharacterized protein n=1 Tax=Daldinia decipiens TaxID=326647 RepID=UPI0020C418D8|nr:uncharacterized protein F4813DRAFT_390804 [Daldinia decipiens]KAI1656437.1 hypothetical protein F4813DRAFT_390804 [Daldinia decipiens]